MDKTKYLYWLDPDNSKFESEVLHREMYCRVGHILHIIQLCEYNLANILSLEEYEQKKGEVLSPNDVEELKIAINGKYEKLSSCTFGKLKKEVSGSLYLSDMNLDALKKIVDYRNYIVHRCFKEKLVNGELSSLDDVDRFVNELNGFEEQVASLNEYLVSVFKQNKTKEIWLHFFLWQ